jgi:hypothetical protein
LKGNIWWESNVRRLFPVGEVNGSHGIYRPGGAALNAGQVGGLRAAMYIAKRCKEGPPSKDHFLNTAHNQIMRIFEQATNAIKADADESILTSALGEVQERITRFGAHIRSPSDIKRAVDDAWALHHKLIEEGRVKNKKDLPQLFKILDLCLTHAVYLEAIQEYIDKGGKSRGSFLVLESVGEKPCKEMNDDWRFILAEEPTYTHKKILEIMLDDKMRVQKQWVDVRPIPQEERWFEEVWKEFREDKIIR